MDYVASSNKRNKGKDKKHERKKHPYKQGGRDRLRESSGNPESVGLVKKKKRR